MVANTALEDFFIKKYEDTSRYKIWKTKNTIFLYDKKKKIRKSLNEEIRKKIISDRKREIRNEHINKNKKYSIIKAPTRKTISYNFSHLFKFECAIKHSEHYEKHELPKLKEHYYYVLSRKGIPSVRNAVIAHNRDYPDHEYLKCDYINSKEPLTKR